MVIDAGLMSDDDNYRRRCFAGAASAAAELLGDPKGIGEGG